MAKKNTAQKTKKETRNISFTPLLYAGIIVVLVTALLQNMLPSFPEAVKNVLYFIGVLALIVYMFQIAFEKRTGKSENGAESKENRLKNRK